jgi:hypothetical protein
MRGGRGDISRACNPDLDFGLDENALMMREAAGRFADEQIAPWPPRSMRKTVFRASCGCRWASWGCTA